MANEKRLIDANALVARYRDVDYETKDTPWTLRDILFFLEKAPTVDAVEVVHGWWVLQRYYGGVRKGMIARVICSECGYPNGKTNYCPSCGAKMDGD